MNNSNLRVITALFILCSVIFVNCVAAERSVGLGQVAENLLEPVGVLSKFVDTACYVIGGIFLFTALIKYFEHRHSPMMVPISTVVFLLIAGIILILLPFFPLLTGKPIF